ncbi:MAG: LytTR family DNA-binding domain-containing protein [Selenomonadaceae bacterium]|nr:LytTR family transcriptional regulator [Selenomonadaceae bacterium]MDD6120111.1 LytTR family DNA-binding domain-containing protein [Selenomonadaceae bacterium]MDD7055776.1 LytTR family DNA-binding domain-containing protein [Selenomonadaceae bacterium]MDY3916805.1 LytTR family DNA-binding domain-containing protein [Selenomonadaceae bacterium]
MPLKDITHIESDGHDLIVHRTQGREPLRTRMTMAEAEELFADARFLRVNRSFLINMDEVDDVVGDAFILTDGAHITMRRQGRAALREAYESHLYRRMRE